MASASMSSPAFNLDRFDIHLKIFSFPRKFAVYSPEGQLVAYCQKSAFKLREEVKIFADQEMSRQILGLQARKIINFSGAYDITDTSTGQRIGVLQRKGWKSLLKDEWVSL